jgi:cyclin-dependent kinase 2
MDEYNVMHEIGSGAYGNVYSVHLRKQVFALKISRLDDNAALNSGIVREWIFAKSFFPSDNVCPILKKWSDRKSSYFLMPLYDCTLYEYAKLAELSYADFQTIAHLLQNGILNMHKQNWLHRDLKPDNIYLNRAGDLVVGDFNLVRFQDLSTDVHPQTSGGTTHICTLWSRAPELVWAEIQGKSVLKTGTEIDAFSFGIVLLSLVRGDYVFGRHAEGSGNTKEVRYLNGFLDVIGVDSSIRSYYDLLPDQLYKDYKDAPESLLAYMPKWQESDRLECAALIAGLLDPLPKRRRRIQDCKFVKTTFNTKVCAEILASKTEKSIGHHGPGLFEEEKFHATMGQMSFLWGICVTKEIPLPIAMHALLAFKRVPVFRNSSVYSILNMLHMIHRYQTFHETAVEVNARCFLDCIVIVPGLWKLCEEIENEPFLCCVLASWIATSHSLPVRKDLDESDYLKTLIHKDIDSFFNKKATRTMLESWRRLS